MKRLSQDIQHEDGFIVKAVVADYVLHGGTDWMTFSPTLSTPQKL